MQAINVLSTMALTANENLGNPTVGGTSRMITQCEKSSPNGREMSVSYSPEGILLGPRSLYLPLHVQHIELSTWFTKGLNLDLSQGLV